jgi:8-oxo-dGTP diphosphatase
MTDCPDILCHVFRAGDHEGEPTETDEALPVWTSVNAIPYDRMWEDDHHWLPLLLAGTTFHGRFAFEGETMRWMELRTDVSW